MTFAADTSVSVERSRAEIESTLARYGADRFGYYTGDDGAVIGFRANGRIVQFHLPLPTRNERRFTHKFDGLVRREVPRTPEDTLRAWEQACRQRWRALALVVKAKLEAVECGITTFEQEFLAHIVLPNRQTIGEWIRPQLERAYATQKMPPLLPGGSE